MVKIVFVHDDDVAIECLDCVIILFGHDYLINQFFFNFFYCNEDTVWNKILKTTI